MAPHAASATVVRVSQDVGADASAHRLTVKTLAHELAHIECGHTADDFDYRGCRGRAEAEAESVACIVTAWAGLGLGGCTVPYVAAWSAGDTDVVRAAAATVTAAARRILGHLHGAGSSENTAGDGDAAPLAGPAGPTAGARALATAGAARHGVTATRTAPRRRPARPPPRRGPAKETPP